MSVSTPGPAVDLIEHAAGIIVAEKEKPYTAPYHWAGALWEAGMLVPPGDAMSTDGRVRLYPAQPDRPAPVDPSEVRVGDVVEIEGDDGSWMVRGEVGHKMDDSTDWPLLLKAEVWADDYIRPLVENATVRILRRAEPEPDPLQVEELESIYSAAVEAIPYQSDGRFAVTDLARELVRRNVRVVPDDR